MNSFNIKKEVGATPCYYDHPFYTNLYKVLRLKIILNSSLSMRSLGNSNRIMKNIILTILYFINIAIFEELENGK